jgi:hypothetical protein
VEVTQSFEAMLNNQSQDLQEYDLYQFRRRKGLGSYHSKLTLLKRWGGDGQTVVNCIEIVGRAMTSFIKVRAIFILKWASSRSS